jgi:hypothetical protein
MASCAVNILQSIQPLPLEAAAPLLAGFLAEMQLLADLGERLPLGEAQDHPGTKSHALLGLAGGGPYEEGLFFLGGESHGDLEAFVIKGVHDVIITY